MQRFPTAFLSIIACAAIAGCTDKTNRPVAPAASPAQISSSLQRSEASDEFQGEDDSDSAYTLAVIGDTPYGPIKLAEFPALTANINADPRVSLVAHLGDIKAGKNSLCTNEYINMIRGHSTSSTLHALHPSTPVVDNIMRIVVEGSDAGRTEYLRLTVDPRKKSSALFSWERVPLN